MSNCEQDLECNAYVKSEVYKNGDTSSSRYETCCVKSTYCSAYYQTWFLVLCITMGILLMLTILLGYNYYKRRREIEVIKEDASEPTTPEIVIE